MKRYSPYQQLNATRHFNGGIAVFGGLSTEFTTGVSSLLM